ncbi:MAG TPA: PadR family transcriptional regulator [Gemmatimonadaceae bacterium]|nr:PadR family transcriptional regulator [Gemmatimonadaceae bacterium]
MAVIRGTLDVLVLKALSWGPMHGFEIAQWLEHRSRGEFPIENAALLQALHRLEARECLVGAWGVTENNRKARYYTLTGAGREALREETDAIRQSVSALTDILSARSPKLREAE